MVGGVRQPLSRPKIGRCGYRFSTLPPRVLVHVMAKAHRSHRAIARPELQRGGDGSSLWCVKPPRSISGGTGRSCDKYQVPAWPRGSARPRGRHVATGGGDATCARIGARSAPAGQRKAEIIRISPLAIRWICTRIRYRRGQRAMGKWWNNGSLLSREYLLANEPLFLPFTPQKQQQRTAPAKTERTIHRAPSGITGSVLPVVAATRGAERPPVQ